MVFLMDSKGAEVQNLVESDLESNCTMSTNEPAKNGQTLNHKI